MVPGIVREPLRVKVVAVGKFHRMYGAFAFWNPLKFGGDQVKLFDTPLVSTLMISGVAAVGKLLNCRVEIFARFAAVISSMFCTPEVSVTEAVAPWFVSTTLFVQLARLADWERNVLNALEKPMSPDWLTDAVG